MMRLPGLLALGEREGVPVITIEELIRFMEERKCENDPTAVVEVPEFQRVSFEVETTVPTEHGDFRVRAYRDRSTGADHVAFVKGPVVDGTLVRVHSECLTGEAFGSLKCECGPQLDAALDAHPATRAASSSTCAATRAAASASSTSCAPTACRRRASTPSTRTSRSACPPTRATTAPRPRSCATSASVERAAAEQQPREAAPARGARHRP